MTNKNTARRYDILIFNLKEGELLSTALVAVNIKV